MQPFSTQFVDLYINKYLSWGHKHAFGLPGHDRDDTCWLGAVDCYFSMSTVNEDDKPMEKFQF